MGTFTMATGFGMLFTGLVVMLLGLTVIWLVINRIKRNEKEEQERKKMERMFN